MDEMIHIIPRLIATISGDITLLADYVLAKNTPVGVGIGFNTPSFPGRGMRQAHSSTGCDTTAICFDSIVDHEMLPSGPSHSDSEPLAATPVKDQQEPVLAGATYLFTGFREASSHGGDGVGETFSIYTEASD